jgi:hypothetical protein
MTNKDPYAKRTGGPGYMGVGRLLATFFLILMNLPALEVFAQLKRWFRLYRIEGFL